MTAPSESAIETLKQELLALLTRMDVEGTTRDLLDEFEATHHQLTLLQGE